MQLNTSFHRHLIEPHQILAGRTRFWRPTRFSTFPDFVMDARFQAYPATPLVCNAASNAENTSIDQLESFPHQ